MKNLYWRRIKISRGVSYESISKAKLDANTHPEGVLKNFEFTEKNFEWVLLYNHIRKGQITPWVMRNMRRKDLYYLAGLTFPHPSLAKPQELDGQLSSGTIGPDAEQRWEQLSKIQGNAIRAQEELRRRNFFWATLFVVIAALTGGLVSGILARGF